MVYVCRSKLKCGSPPGTGEIKAPGLTFADFKPLFCYLWVEVEFNFCKLAPP